jgi:hypothetical protein
MLKTFSATQILEDLTGEAQWEEAFGVELSDDWDVFDQFESESEDESDMTSSQESPIGSPLRAPTFYPSISCSDNECSICYTEFSNFAAELDCGHRFCESCVASYLKAQIDQAPRLHHKISEVCRNDDAVIVTVNDLVGVKCPHYSCQRIIDEKKIKSFVDEHTWDKFDRFALDQTLTNLQINGELTPCPLGCGYFIQEDCLCVNPDCRKKQLAYRNRPGNRPPPQAPAMPKLTKEPMKLCPSCSCAIEKNGGCDHMYCPRCKKPFNWSTARILLSGPTPENMQMHELKMKHHHNIMVKKNRKALLAWKGY